MSIEYPSYANVAFSVLRQPPIPRSSRNGISTYELDTLLVVIACAQQIVGQEWKRGRQKEYWRKQKSMAFTLPVKRLARYCSKGRHDGKGRRVKVSPALLLKRLQRFMSPVGEIPIDGVISLLPTYLPPPLLKVTPYIDRQNRQCVSISLDVSWVHLTDHYTSVDLPLPVGRPKACARYLGQCLERGMSKLSKITKGDH